MSANHGMLSHYFEAIGFKRLAKVEVDPTASNEHEFNGVSRLKGLFSEERLKRVPCRSFYLCDDEDLIQQDLIHLTWYDARENNPTRSEYRLYYTESECIHAAQPDDLMLLCKNIESSAAEPPYTLFLAKAGDTITAQLLWLFGVEDKDVTDRFIPHRVESGNALDFYSSLILEKAGITLLVLEDELLDRVVDRFPDAFPRTRVFSAFAREFSEIDPREDPDLALSDWLNLEDRVFRLLEKHLLSSKIQTGFDDVDDFIKFSLSVQNRRKSRAGRALENHLQELFSRLDLTYSFDKVTEHTSRPDFVFPGLTQYKDENFPESCLTMLGAKTTCKDRWRQVLAEAARIPQKHLCTLEPSISANQTDEMVASNLQLVVPRDIFQSYSAEQQDWLMSVSEFTSLIRERQISGGPPAHG